MLWNLGSHYVPKNEIMIKAATINRAIKNPINIYTIKAKKNDPIISPNKFGRSSMINKQEGNHKRKETLDIYLYN